MRLFLSAFLAALLLAGCGQDEPDVKNGDGSTTVVSTTAPEPGATPGDPTSGGNAGAGSGGSTASTAPPGTRPGTSPVADDARTPGKQTTMTIDSSEMDRLRQNGPTAEQRKNRRYRDKVTSKPVIASKDGNGAPVFADDIEKVQTDG